MDRQRKLAAIALLPSALCMFLSSGALLRAPPQSVFGVDSVFLSGCLTGAGCMVLVVAVSVLATLVRSGPPR